MMRRDAAYEKASGKWQMLVAKARGIRMLGIYASPSALAADWT